MSLLKLQNIGKIYVSENSVAVGIRGINLEFNKGEFVAITGKSGAGKSTLLNVISGIDTYEEGELFVNGEPTSHFVQKDWEEYRKEYISFVFQDYNILESFTVLENVELALTNIRDLKERRKKALELINRVGLSSHIHCKGSKLSGGQKQRTVIARALAKDSPIILADEPTGNLDSKSGKEIVELLSEISNDKLVIVVTHNFEDFENYATRHIRVFDGGIESDETLKQIEYQEYVKEEKEEKPKKFKDSFSLAIAIFKSKPRLTVFMCLLLLLGTFGVFLITSLMSNAFNIFKKNYMFTQIDGRVVITHQDGSPLTEEELGNLKTKYDFEEYLHYDILLDSTSELIYIPEIENYLNCKTIYGKDYGDNIIGRYPEKENEAFLYLPISYKDYFGTEKIKINTISYYNLNENSSMFNVVGIKYYVDNNITPEILVTKEGFRLATNLYYLNSFINGKYYIEVFKDGIANYFELQRILPSSNIPKDKMYISQSDYRYAIKNTTGVLTTIKLNLNYYKYTNYYYEPDDTYNKEYIYGKKFIIDEFDGSNLIDRTLYVGIDLFNEIIEGVTQNCYCQSSLFFKNNNKASNAIEGLKNDGFIAVMSNETYLPSAEDSLIIMITCVFSLIGWVLIIIFIALFINLCTNKSMDTFKNDIAIMRSMGISEKSIKMASLIRILICLIPAYLITTIGSQILYNIPVTNSYFTYLYLWEYLLIFIGILILAFQVTRRQNKRLFKSSVKKALNGGDSHD